MFNILSIFLMSITIVLGSYTELGNNDGVTKCYTQICSLVSNLENPVDQIIQKKPMKNAPLAYRYNNPGNLRPFKVVFEGQVKVAKGGWAIFEDMESGILAMALVLSRYQTRHNIRTVNQLINRYDHRRDPKYKAHMCKVLGVGLHEPFSFKENMVKLIHGMIYYEAGPKTYEKMGLSYDKIKYILDKELEV